MEENAKKPLILIDGSSYLYRAFHALPPLLSSKGEPTGAIYGVVNMLRKLIADFAPSHIAIIFDSKKKSFRHEIYQAYKANRPKMPDDLIAQVEPLHEIIRAMGLPIVVIDGVEADDVIGTLAAAAERQNFDTLIITGDKDMAQIVDNHIKLLNTMTMEALDAKAVQNKFGVPPERITDYLALVGDASDNVPGVPGVGPKTAAKWLEQYGSLEQIINHAAEISGKVGENLRQSLEQLPLAKKLVTLKIDVALDFAPDDLNPMPPDAEKLIELFTRFEFKKWLQDLSSQKKTPNPNNENYQIILTASDFEILREKLIAASWFAVDTETTSLDTFQAKLVGLSFSTKPGEGVYIPLAHDYLGAPEQLALDFVLQQLKPLLEDPNKIKLGQNIKYDMEVLLNYGIKLQGANFDTMLESYVLNSSSNKHDLDTLAVKYLGISTTTFASIAKVGKQQLTFNQIALETAGPYAAEDAEIVVQLHEKLFPQLTADPGLTKVFTEIDMPLVKVLTRMERIGVYLDSQLLNRQSQEITLRIKELENEAYNLAGGEFNLSSPKQVQEILFTKLKIPSSKKTPGGQQSTAEEVLQVLALNYPLPKIILEHRSLSKLKSTYLDKLPLQVNPKTNRVHTSYNQAVTTTGRLSSTNPNLQNIPIRTEEGRKIRQAFIAPPGKKIIAADYSQIELRVMAHMAQDSILINAFNSGEDIHQATAAEVFNINSEEVTADYRRRAKTINFGLIYGMSAFGLAQALEISVSEAQAYIELYFKRYPGVKNYMQETSSLAKRNGYVTTLFGRRIYVTDIMSNNPGRKNAAERAAINAPIQGTAADIIKLAMIKIDNWLETASLDIKMIMQVHDELVFEVAEQDAAYAVSEITAHMTQGLQLSVPLVVDIGVGNNWDEAH
jgi:DNA polymerase I